MRTICLFLFFSLFLTACGSSPQSSPLLREPYLQSITNNSVAILFITAEPVQATLSYSSSSNSNSQTEPTSTTRHTFLLEHLQPGTTYTYSLIISNHTLSKHTYYFTTDDSTKKTLHFAVLGDIGVPDGVQGKTIQSILALPEQPAFLLISGDIVYPRGASADYDANLFNYLPALAPHTPIFPALGNHDWDSDPKTNYEQEWYLPNNEHYYSFNYGNAHFIVLDTRYNDALFDAENQTRWLIQDLAAHQHDQWRFVMAHYPGLTCTYKPVTRSVVALYPIFEQYHVDIYFTGHAHTYERLYPLQNQTPNTSLDPHYVNPSSFITITTGAAGRLETGWKENPTCIYAAKLKNTEHFLDIHIADQQLSLAAYDHSGTVFDQITILKTTNNTLLQNPRPY